MKTIGIIGGMSWESTQLFYKLLNKKVQHYLGGSHSCKCIVHSVDFAEVAELQHKGQWAELANKLVAIAKQLELAGADFIVLCTNTMHKVAPAIQAALHIPFLHIVDVVAEEIKQQKITRVGLLGTKFTMEEDFLKGKYSSNHSIEIVIPSKEEREIIHRVIYNELINGVFTIESKTQFIKIINNLKQIGAEGIIAGCTEIELLVQQKDLTIPLFRTTEILAESAVRFSIAF
jgi:aspartate racemase